MARPLLVVLVLVMALMVVSWVFGELLRQRKEDDRRKGRRR
ncbi:MAG: hypothetical protein AB7H88_10970 [Vicinamibacterales bacterium]